ncbi:MAG: adenosylmethionine--8-amino-7-oxononanoate transaminase [Verrucomicrobiota bacterium]|nr:adenosylmethionine--8-amino-7-oxononanoate transaminase [Verrucomicrobiota bacterium]
MNSLLELDRKYIWHPFTQMSDWMASDPIIIQKGRGAYLYDINGQKYLDANSSIWTNLHGHAHPVINRAIRQQLSKISHSSALGLANEPASILAGELVPLANAQSRFNAQPELARLFYSDDGSTAMEVALKLAYEYTRRLGKAKKPRFLGLNGAYHGDTIGAVSLGHIDLFHKNYSGLLFESDSVMAPYCYRCPFNQAKPERADARTYRKCKWECVGQVEKAFATAKKSGNSYAGVVVEPLMQGAAGMVPQPTGWLKDVSAIARQYDALLIADEVMTGFGRVALRDAAGKPSYFASHAEGIIPDLMAVAKGMTGGYLPMAATFATQPIFDLFLGRYDEFKTFFHGHSFTANQLGSAAACASIDILKSPQTFHRRARLEQAMKEGLEELWLLPQVGDIRQSGCVAGIELVADWRQRTSIPLAAKAGIRVCTALAEAGVLTRPIGNVIVLMPPFCTKPDEIKKAIMLIAKAIRQVFSS